jgi:hypothetical protein
MNDTPSITSSTSTNRYRYHYSIIHLATSTLGMKQGGRFSYLLLLLSQHAFDRSIASHRIAWHGMEAWLLYRVIYGLQRRGARHLTPLVGREMMG